MNYIENDANKDQQIQSSCFGQQCFSIFTACCYLKIKICKWDLTVTSQASDNSGCAALSCWLRVLFIVDKNQCLSKSLIVNIWSNNERAGQVRSRFPLSLLSQFAHDHNSSLVEPSNTVYQATSNPKSWC